MVTTAQPGSAPAAPVRAAPPRAPGARPAGVDALYVDEARTHQVQARLAQEDGAMAFVVMESPYDAFTQDDLLYTRLPIQSPWEATFHRADLEGRLAQMGKYWRYTPEQRGWLPLRLHPGVPRIDLRPVEWQEGDAQLAFHHFHRTGERARLLLTLTKRLGVGARYLVADLEMDFPRARDGVLRILHERIPAGPLRSLLAREHVDLARKGYDKLSDPREFALVYGPDWREMMRNALDVALDRVRENEVGDGSLPRATGEDEGAVHDYHRLLLDPRLAAVHRRFLPKEEEDLLLSTTHVHVQRWIASRRKTARHDDQHLLSLLEASLLARLCIRDGRPLDAVVAKQLRRLAFYM